MGIRVFGVRGSKGTSTAKSKGRLQQLGNFCPGSDRDLPDISGRKTQWKNRGCTRFVW